MIDEFSKIDEALHALREGRIIIVVDDEDRENEGDFVAAAETVTPETVEFMITHGRGLLCMPILPEVGLCASASSSMRTLPTARSRVRCCEPLRTASPAES